MTLIAHERLGTIPTEYLDFIDIFFKKSAIILLEHIKINIYGINLE